MTAGAAGFAIEQLHTCLFLLGKYGLPFVKIGVITGVEGINIGHELFQRLFDGLFPYLLFRKGFPESALVVGFGADIRDDVLPGIAHFPGIYYGVMDLFFQVFRPPVPEKAAAPADIGKAHAVTVAGPVVNAPAEPCGIGKGELLYMAGGAANGLCFAEPGIVK